MENYKKSLRTRLVLLGMLALFAAACSIYDQFFASEALKASPLFGFQAGLLIGLGLVSVIFILRINRILRDDAKLKLEYNREHDERLKAIRAKSGMPMLLITSAAMVIAGVIAGYFNTVIFITLVLAAMGQMLIGAIVKQIYLRKM